MHIIGVPTSGRFVIVQMNDKDYLNLREVKARTGREHLNWREILSYERIPECSEMPGVYFANGNGKTHKNVEDSGRCSKLCNEAEKNVCEVFCIFNSLKMQM